jgi:hypothetical protein
MSLTPEIEQALRTAATEARIVDPDLVTLPVFEEIVGRMASESDAVRAVAEMQQARPKLFLHDDYAKMDSTQFETAEDAFREKLRKRSKPASRQNEFKQLDSALLGETEHHALRRYLGGTRNSYDLSILNAALTRQTGPRGDAA